MLPSFDLRWTAHALSVCENFALNSSNSSDELDFFLFKEISEFLNSINFSLEKCRILSSEKKVFFTVSVIAAVAFLWNLIGEKL